jgi:predicted nucleotidyltransferase
MIYTTDEIRQRITPIAEKYQLRRIYLFGSYARNEAGNDSDIDVLVDITDSKVKGWILGGLYNDLCETFGENVDLITTDVVEQNQKRDRRPWFVENILKERILIYEQ